MRGLWFVLLCVGSVSAESPADLRTRKTGSDWPTFLGPTGDGISTETGIETKWPREGLKVLWDVPMGKGYAPPSVAKGRLFHVDRFGNALRLTCRNAETGKLLWKYEYETFYNDLYGYDGARACPVVDDDRVYFYGPDGFLCCLNVTDGKELWKLDTVKDFHVHQNFFGVGSVPVVEGDMLIVAVGGSPKGARPLDLRDAKPDGSCLVAYEKKTGKVIYKIGNDLASYATPLIRNVGDKRLGFYFARAGLVVFDPKAGKVESQFPWRAKILESVNASNPVLVKDQLLITECYGLGAALLKIKDKGSEKVWADDEKDRDDKSLRCHWNTPIYVDGYVYASSGRHENEAELRCVEWATGKIMWKEPNLSRASLTLIDGHFLCLTERGELYLLKVNPKKFDKVAKWVTELDSPSWAAPVVSNGLLYVRGQDRLLCAELIPAKK